MSVTHRIQQRFQRGNDVIDKIVASASGSEHNLDEPIADSVSDLLVAWTCDFSQLKSFYMVADQDLTVETNNGTTPDDTFNLKANVPVVWTEECQLANPFTVDVTALYVSNSSGSATVLKVRSLQDPTV